MPHLDEQLPRQTGKKRQFWLRSHRPLWVVAVVNLLVLGIIIFVLAAERQRDYDIAVDTLGGISQSIDDVLSWRFEKIHLALLNAVDEVERQARAGKLDWNSFDDFGKTLDERLPETLGFLVTDAENRVTYASPRALSSEITIASTEQFARLHESALPVIAVSRPFHGHAWPHPIIVISTRYAAPDGSFGGIAACAVSINMFSAALSSAEILGASGLATLWDKDIGLVAQYPELSHKLDAKPSAALHNLIAHDASSVIYRHTRPDFAGKERIAFFRGLSQWPLYLSLGVFSEDVFGKWRQEAATLGFLGFVFLVVSVWSGFAYTRHVTALECSEKRYKGLFGNMQAGIALFEPVARDDGTIVDFRFIDVNEAYCDIFSTTPEDVIGKTVKQRIPAEQQEILAWLKPLITSAENGDSARFDLFISTCDAWIDMVAYRPQAGNIAILCIDITDRKRAEARSSRLSKLYAALSKCNHAIVLSSGKSELFFLICRAVVESGGMKAAWIGIVDPETGHVRPSAAFNIDLAELRRLPVPVGESDPYGLCSAVQAIRDNAPVWLNDMENDPGLKPWSALLRETGFRSLAALPLRRKGQPVGGLVVFAAERNAFGADARELLGEMASNVSYALDNLAWEEERRRHEARINELAFYDQLTGLANRPLLADRITQAAASGRRNNTFNALFFIDIDNFKAINDTLGHAHGDSLLRHVAERLSSNVRADDTVARFGGDEFVLLLQGLSGNQQEAMEKVGFISSKVLAAISAPMQVNGVSCHCTASIGVTLFGKIAISADEVLKQADMAMYEAKYGGRNTMRFFDPMMQKTVLERLELERDMEEALGRGEFVLYYQPQLSGCRVVVGAEALIRWRHPTRGMVAPAEFIPLAEENGMILNIGNWVLREACAQIARWAEVPGLSRLSVSVNVSARQFREDEFSANVMRAVHEAGIDPSLLKLELTESQLAVNLQEIIAKMVSLSNQGIRFSLDDFGTGYSSLAYLKRLPLEQLKIDGSFVRDLLTNPNDAAIAGTIITLAQSLGLDAVAEGVETDAQRDALLRMGCGIFQGFLFSAALAPQEFELFVAATGKAVQ